MLIHDFTKFFDAHYQTSLDKMEKLGEIMSESVTLIQSNRIWLTNVVEIDVKALWM